MTTDLSRPKHALFKVTLRTICASAGPNAPKSYGLLRSSTRHRKVLALLSAQQDANLNVQHTGLRAVACKYYSGARELLNRPKQRGVLARAERR